MNEANENEIMDFGYKKKSKAWIYILVVLLIAALSLCGFLYYQRTHNGKLIVNRYVSNMYDFLLDNFDESTNNSFNGDINDIYDIESSFNVYTNYEMDGLDLSKLKDYTFNTKSILSFKDKELYSSVGIKNKNKDLINVETYFNESDLLLKCEQLLNKVIEIPLEETTIDFDSIINSSDFSDIKKISKDEIKYIINFHKDFTLEYLKGLKYISEKESLNSKKVIKTTIDLTSKEVIKYEKEFIDKIINDKKMLDIFSKFEIKKEDLEEIKNQYSELSDDEETITINLYTYPLTGKFVKLELIEDNESLMIVEKTDKIYSIKIDDLEITYNEEKHELVADIFTLTFDKNEITLSVDLSEDLNMKFKIHLKGTEENYKINIKFEVEVTVIKMLEDPLVINLNGDVNISKTNSVKKLEGSKIKANDLGQYSQEISNNLYSIIEGTLIEDIVNLLYEDNTVYIEEDF